MNEKITKTIIERLIAFHEEMPKVYKDSNNPYFKSKYSTYENIMRVCTPVLLKQGLLVSHDTFIEGDKEYLRTRVYSIEGDKLDSVSLVNPSKNDIQAKGAFFTYLKRYHVVMLLGIGIYDENDDDCESLAKGVISKDQVKKLEILLNNKKELKERVLKGYDISELSELPRSEFNKCTAAIIKTVNGGAK